MMQRDFWYLWQSQLVSQAGAQAFQVLALFWMASHTHHPGAGALFLALSLLPPVLFGPALARWSTRFSPKRVMVTCDMVASMLALPVLLAILADAPVAVTVAMLMLSNALLALARALMMPTVLAAVPILAGKQSLQTANGWIQTTQQVSSVIGQGVGGVAYALIGPAGLCLMNMVGFMVSSTLTSRMRSSDVCHVPVAAPRAAPVWGLLRSNVTLRNLSIVSAVFNVLYAPWLVLLPFHLSPRGTPEASTLGLVLASYGLGSLCGNLGLTRLLKKSGTGFLWIAMGGMALLLALLGQTTTAVQTASVLFLMGAGIGLVNVQITTRVQMSVDATLRSEAIAVMRSSVNIATPLGYGMVALAQHTLNMSPGAVYTACGVTLLVSLLLMHRKLLQN